MNCKEIHREIIALLQAIYREAHLARTVANQMTAHWYDHAETYNHNF